MASSNLSPKVIISVSDDTGSGTILSPESKSSIISKNLSGMVIIRIPSAPTNVAAVLVNGLPSAPTNVAAVLVNGLPQV